MTSKEILMSKGVTLLAPETITVDPDVNPENFDPGSVIHPGCRLRGSQLSLGRGCVIGAEAPVTLGNCQLGERVQLAGGFFEGSTFLDGFSAGSGAHVRPGCLFEEGSSLAHSVGVKQTLFLPWVTAGSLINFCDCLMAGGTSRRNHSEIGSSYIHFNFTPHQDKATPSLIGDIPRGVLLNQPPIFLGGQGGMVGPSSIAFGTVLPAGQIWRGDHSKPGQIVLQKSGSCNAALPFIAGRYKGIGRIVRSNLRYIGNLAAMDLWYHVVRRSFMQGDPSRQRCFNGARQRLQEMFAERLRRMEELAGNIEKSLALPGENPFRDEHREFLKGWEGGRERLTELFSGVERSAVPGRVPPALAALSAAGAGDYIAAVQGLAPESAEAFADWLDSCVAAAESVL